ncbi:MAG: bifunctional phosphopantothenoylcysteine decarboxylase/phosphopantothenate--cysteine ligase CoaBC [Gammaproteobacteria bacterium]|jgi:phosphopantothenoylcysteine decarboxylase/phosphopantothenate--cysteine ligase|nr:bifunctional phosphopantothenoylcysteine decarboxylase/phosphopantothenate--cysteine ligase CoaBC [Gammaproteobacteria bacterium]
MNKLSGKHVLLGVTGGIAAYKSAELVRQLRRQGAEVRVVMTAAATEFVTPLTFQALSGHPVHTQLLDTGAEAAMGHIELARWADVLLIAPATADFMARLVAGRANDLLTAVSLACDATLAIAPAMNRVMWDKQATRENMMALKQRGVQVLGPAEGLQACGDSGPGRMLEPVELLAALSALLDTGTLAGRRVLVTAGPTREAIDPVRYISNRSSGRMGYAVAAAAVEAGADVLLISGPVSLETPPRARRIDVESAAEMHAAVMSEIALTDIFISVAAVADYRPASVASQKLKKTAATLSLELKRNPDILAEVAALTDAPFTVGFAAETQAMESNARDKLRAKNIDMIAANVVGQQLGFDCEDNALRVIWGQGEQQLPLAGKGKLARQLVAIIAERFALTIRGETQNPQGKVFNIHAKDSA